MASKSKENKTIVLPISEEEYEEFINKPCKAHEVIIKYLNQYPELFPSAMIEKGYTLKGKDRISKKMGIQLRRIKVGKALYRIRPSFMLSYMRGRTKEVEHALLLIRFGVPFWVIAMVFGRNAMYWYRLFISLGAVNVVGTTVYDKSKLTNDILADEFHIRIKGTKAYIATIIGGDCFLGVQACAQADEVSLRSAYGVFKSEVLKVVADYQPFSINTDGWKATQNALAYLFNQTIMVE